MASDKPVQRTITSFFQKSDGKVQANSKKPTDAKLIDEVQPAKRKRRVISSDEEDGCASSTKPLESEMKHNTVKKIKEEELNQSPLKPKDLTGVKIESTEISSHDDARDKKQPILQEKSSAVLNSNTTIDEKSYYFPNKSGYHPVNDAPWKKGTDVPYLALAHTLAQIEENSSRLKMIEILSNYFRSVILQSPDDLLCSIYLCLNQLAPAYVGIELGVGESLVMKALAQATGRSLEKVKADVIKKGDIGLVAEASKATQKTLFKTKDAGLTVKGVFKRLTEIAVMSGNASQTRKVDKIQSLLVVSKQLEARFIVRSLVGKLRIGLAEQSLLQALALAGTATPPHKANNLECINCLKDLDSEAIKSKVEVNALKLKTAYCECPSYDRIIPVFLREGIENLASHCSLTPGVPLKPMLACPARGVSEVLQRFEGSKFTCEWKYDGERAQIHLLEDGDVRIYSRNQENNTTKYPDIVSRFRSWISPSAEVHSAILDSEAVAWDPEKKQILPFQVLSTRKRKDAAEADIKVQVLVFGFDLLYLNGESLTRHSLAKRREKLKEYFHKVDGQFEFATSKDPSSVEEIEEFLDESIKGNCEGLMVKGLEKDATYEIAKRSKNWLKLKKDYIDGIGDTIDVVVIGGYLGKGKRTGVYGGFLLACYDESNEEYQSLCKIGTGFAEEDLLKHSEFLKQKMIPQPKPYYRFDSTLAPDHWFEPCQVWEIKCADLSLSPVHRAAVGIADPVKGISLRFPRFIRVRDDKNPEDATSAEQIAELYAQQDQVKNQIKDNDEEGFY